jgi:outer membrane lipoprotein-sorting protein
MRKTLCLTAAVVLGLAAAGAARADEKADARAVIEKAVKALGGEEKVAAKKAVTFKTKGKFYGLGDGIDYTGEFSVQPPDKIRMQIDSSANGMKFTLVIVFDGKQGWTKFNDQATEMDKDAVEETKESMYAGAVEALTPLLKDKDFELSMVGEVKVGGHETVGVRVAHKGHRDVNLFFDKKTGLLVKTERRVKDQMTGGQEVTEERLLDDYKETGGVKHPTKVVVKRDGKDYSDNEVTDYQTVEQLDDSVFAKP